MPPVAEIRDTGSSRYNLQEAVEGRLVPRVGVSPEEVAYSVREQGVRDVPAELVEPAGDLGRVEVRQAARLISSWP